MLHSNLAEPKIRCCTLMCVNQWPNDKVQCATPYKFGSKSGCVGFVQPTHSSILFWILLKSKKVVSAIFSIFYGIVAFEKEVFDQWFDFDHLVAFERHAAYLMAGFICLFVISSIVGCMSLLGE